MGKIIKNTVLAVALIIFILAVSGCSYYRSVSSGAGNMEKTATTKQTSNNMISFELKKGDKLKVKYESKVKEGSLKIQLKDSKGSVVEDIDTNKSGSREITAEADGKYEFYASYEDFIGSFKIHVSK